MRAQRRLTAVAATLMAIGALAAVSPAATSQDRDMTGDAVTRSIATVDSVTTPVYTPDEYYDM